MFTCKSGGMACYSRRGTRGGTSYISVYQRTGQYMQAGVLVLSISDTSGLSSVLLRRFFHPPEVDVSPSMGGCSTCSIFYCGVWVFVLSVVRGDGRRLLSLSASTLVRCSGCRGPRGPPRADCSRPRPNARWRAPTARADSQALTPPLNARRHDGGQ